jgi:hypothetical protein
MHADTRAFNAAQSPEEKQICTKLAKLIDAELPEAENKMWHRHPVWFLDGNPIVGYSKLKDCIRLMFWSGRILVRSRVRGSSRTHPCATRALQR